MCAKPDWLDLDRYNFTKALDGEGWYHEITRRLSYRRLWEREPSEDDSPAEHESFQAMRADPERFFEAYLDDVLPEPLESPSIGVQTYLKKRIADNAERSIRALWLDVSSIDEGQPPLEIGAYQLYRTRKQGSASKRQEMLVQLDMESNQRVELPWTWFTRLVKSIRTQLKERRLRFPAVAELTADDEALPMNFEVSSRTRRLIIDLEAAPYEIIEDFKRWLHKQDRGALRRRGQKGFQDTFDKSVHGYRWHRFRILAIFDLDFWFTLSGLERPTQKELAGWLFPDLPEIADKAQRWRDAEDALEDALQTIDELPYVAPQS